MVRDNDNPDHYLFYEVYRDEAAFAAAHRDTDHYARWREAAEVCPPTRWRPPTAMIVTRSDR